MSLEEPPFLNFIQARFKENDADYDSIASMTYASEKDRLAVQAHFYYFICKPDQSDVREELRIVGITSLIEAMMQEVKYKGPFEYFESEYRDQNSIGDFKAFKAEYLAKYGAAKKVREYFDKYLSGNDKKILLASIKVYNEQNYMAGKEAEMKAAYDLVAIDIPKASAMFDEVEKGKTEDNDVFVPLKSIQEVAKLFYEMRSEFVHQAAMHNLKPSYSMLSLAKIGDDAVQFEISIEPFMKIFERSFVTYWKEKASVQL